jgi:uncharacterized protein YuzE
MMKIQCDIEADALYIHITNLKIVDTIPHNKNKNIFFDVSKYGKIVGIEILNASFTDLKSVKNRLKHYKISIPELRIFGTIKTFD